MKAYTVDRVPGAIVVDIQEYHGLFLVWPSGKISEARHYPLANREERLAYIEDANRQFRNG